MSGTAIKVENLYKEYKLGVIGHGTLYRDIQSWWAKARGKEDPNSLISSRHGQEAEKDSFLALNDVSFEVKEGDRVGIIGKNGAGKSTLLKILSRITSPTKGTITIQGKVGSLLEVGTGFHSELTGRENIYLNGSILGMDRREISRKLDEIVDFAGIEKHIDTPVKRYSSGMMVRLGFAVAAHLDTDILIADEVLAVGDAEFQKKALDKMGDLSTGEGRTVLFVSHNMVAVKKLCNKGILLLNGKIEFYGDMEETHKKYTDEHKNVNKYENDGYIHFDKRDNENLKKIFNKIRFLDKNGVFKERFFTMDPMKIEISVDNTRNFPDAKYIVLINNSNMQRVTTYATWLYPSINIKTPKKIIIDIPSISFSPDIYYISLIMRNFDSYIHIDRLEYCAQFCIELSDPGIFFHSSYGVMYPEGNMYLLD